MRRIAALTFVAGLVLGVLAMRFAGHSQSAYATSNCTSQSLVGSYSYLIWDKFVSAPSGSNPTVTAYVIDGGLMTFDGRGGVTFVAEGSFNGFSQFGPENRSGSYSVQANCMGSFTMHFDASPSCCTNHYDFVIVASGRELTILQRDVGTVSAGNAIRQGSIES
jgi:hypothetical protein